MIQCDSDGGMIVTFGSGINGCLGHGNFKDLKEVSNVVCIWYTSCSDKYYMTSCFNSPPW